MTRALPFFAMILTLSAFGITMFFGGYRDIHYAPAIGLILIMALTAILPALKTKLIIPNAPAAFILFALWLYVTLSISWSTVPFASLVTYLVFLALPLCFFAPLLSPAPDQWLRVLFYSFMAAITACALWAIIQYTALHGTFGSRAGHPLPNPNNMAGLINLALLPALALFIGTKDRNYKYAAYLGLSAILFAGLIATESRGGFVAMMISVLILLFTLRGVPPKMWQRLIVMLLMGGIIFSVISFFGGDRFGPRLIELTALSGDSTAQARIAIWENAWPLLKDYLWLGAGLGTFYLYYPGYRMPGADNSTGNWAHLDPLQFGIEMGLIAPILFYAFCLAVTLRTIAFIRKTSKDDPSRIQIIGLFAGLFAMVLHTHVTFHLYIMPILIVTGLWLALWYRLTSMYTPSFKDIILTRWQKTFMALITLSFFGLIGVMAASSSYAQISLIKAQEKLNGGKPEQFINAIAATEQFAPRSFIDSEVQLAGFYIDLLDPRQADAIFNSEEQNHLYEQAMLLLNIAESQNPAWAEISYKRGLLYLTRGFRLDAENAFSEAITKNKTHFKARQALAESYVSRGQAAKAYDVLYQGVQYPMPSPLQKEYIDMLNQLAPLADIQRSYEGREVWE